MAVPRVLLIDDNPTLCRAVQEYLEPLGYDITVRLSGTEGFVQAIQGDFHAVILDVMLPGLDGFSLLKLLREQSDVPVLMLTGRGGAADRIAGLEAGADDYVPKTFSPRELAARLQAIVRRSGARRDLPTRPARTPIVLGHLAIDLEGRFASVDREPIPLTPTEFDLLVSLARDCGRVKTREELQRGLADHESGRAIDVHICSLRRKLGDDAKNPRMIVTVRATGYMLRSPETGQQ